MRRAVGQQALELGAGVGIQLPVEIDEVNVIGMQGLDLGNQVTQGGQQFGMTESGKGGRSSQFEHVGRSL